MTRRSFFSLLLAPLLAWLLGLLPRRVHTFTTPYMRYGWKRCPNTWYHAFRVTDPETGEVFSGFDTSPTGENLAGEVRRVGAERTDANGDVIPYQIIGDVFTWEDKENT